MSVFRERPLVDPQTGDIQAHAREGLNLSITFTDDSGAEPVPRDVTGLPIFFEIAGKLRVPLGPGDTTDERVISVSAEDLKPIWGGVFACAVVDESGTIPQTPWSGFITTYGYEDQPA